VLSSASSSRTRRLGESGVIDARLHQAEHLTDSPRVHIRVLAQIECCEMKAKGIDGAP